MGLTRKRAALAALTRHRGPDDPLVIAASQDLKAAGLEEHIQRLVTGWPPLTAAQRTRLAVLLRSGQDGGAQR